MRMEEKRTEKDEKKKIDLFGWRGAELDGWRALEAPSCSVKDRPSFRPQMEPKSRSEHLQLYLSEKSKCRKEEGRIH